MSDETWNWLLMAYKTWWVEEVPAKSFKLIIPLVITEMLRVINKIKILLIIQIKISALFPCMQLTYHNKLLYIYTYICILYII